MKNKTIIGIDPGSSNGGIAVWKNMKPVRTAKMPKNEDIDQLRDFLTDVKNQDSNCIVFIEKVQMFSTDASDNPGKAYRIKVMLANYERIIALLIFLKIEYVEVYPISWQTTLGLKKKGQTKTEKKNSFKEYAQRCFPEIKVTLRTSDALCLVQFALTKHETMPAWIEERIQNKQKKGLF